MNQLQELIRTINQIFVGFSQHLADFRPLQVLQSVVLQQGILQL